jgi:hypothetical protein
MISIEDQKELISLLEIKKEGFYLSPDHGNFKDYYEMAQKGTIGHFFYLVSDTFAPVHVFFQRCVEWNPHPVLITIDRKEIPKEFPKEFGKIKKRIDEEDLQRSGIKISTDSLQNYIALSIDFIKCFVTKSTDTALAGRMLKTMFNRGIVISPPKHAFSVLCKPPPHIKITELNILWHDCICPSCESFFRDINTSDHSNFIETSTVVATCPYCQTKFCTKS